MGYRRYQEISTIIDGKEVIMLNSYGYYSAEYVKLSGKPYTKEERQKNWFSKSQLLKMKKPVTEDEEPVAFARAMHGYYALFQRD